MAPTGDPIEVVACSDDGYAQPLAVMLLSLFDCCRTRRVHVHLLVPRQFTQQGRLTQALGEHRGLVAFRSVPDEPVCGLKTAGAVTVASYYRLLMAQVLPPEVSRVIYLDCDTIVREDLAKLWETPLGRYPLGAVPDKNFKHRHVLGLAEEAAYFNSGVLLIDLDRWRKAAIGTRALEFAARHPERLTWGDQCALNWLLHDQWLQLDDSWNVQTADCGRMVDGEFRFYRKPPPPAGAGGILHFTAAPGSPSAAVAKPWLYMCEHPFKGEYLSYVRRTPWRERPADRYPHNVILKSLRRYAPALLPVYLGMRRFV
jgi:lipopolysaccharide biosynthesis glycosyltransferase